MPQPSRLLLVTAMPFLLGTTALAARPTSEELVVDMEGAVAGSIDGRAVRFRLAPNGSKVPILNPEAAAQAGLKRGWLNVVALVGTVRVKGSTAVVRYTAPGTALKRRIGWFERPATSGFDGLLGPGAVSASVVTFRLRPSIAGERVHALPLVDDGYGGMGSAVMIGKSRLLVRWSFDKAQTSGNAKAGEILQAERGGRWTGAVHELPVAFGVHRPHRQLELGNALAIGPLSLPGLSIRTAGTESGTTDPDEIVVTASKKKTKGPGVLIFGRDALAGCSSLSFDKARKQVRLVCR